MLTKRPGHPPDLQRPTLGVREQAHSHSPVPPRYSLIHPVELHRAIISDSLPAGTPRSPSTARPAPWSAPTGIAPAPVAKGCRPPLVYRPDTGNRHPERRSTSSEHPAALFLCRVRQVGHLRLVLLVEVGIQGRVFLARALVHRRLRRIAILGLRRTANAKRHEHAHRYHHESHQILPFPVDRLA